MKVKKPALGRKGFCPFKFLNFSRSMEVQTTDSRKLKRKATKEATNQRALSTAQLLLLCFQSAPVFLNGEQHFSLCGQSQHIV
jgi:hypothetical protein